MDELHALVKTAMNLSFTKNAYNFLTRKTSIVFSRMPAP
jgi:hypothetical protein